MWALDYKGPDDYTFVEGELSELMKNYKMNHIFPSKEDAQSLANLQRNADLDISEVYHVVRDTQNQTAHIVKGKKSELLKQGYTSYVLTEQEADLGLKSFQANMYYRNRRKTGTEKKDC